MPEEHDHHLVFSAFENTQMTKSEIVRCENICLQAGLNYRPLVYKTNALPLSYKGRPEEHDHHLVFSAFENTQMTKSEIVRCENICLQAGLNYRPLVYKTNALPLSYKGRPEEHDHHLVFSAFENTQMTKSEIVRCENICLQAGLNYRPLVYKTNALPLSYKGRPEEHDHHLVFSAFENTQMTKSEIVRCENICLQAGLNYRPLVYKTNALPLSYKGRPEEHDHHLVFSAFENTQMTKSEIVRCENICLQAGLNYRPLVYKTNALPLSYKGRPEEHDHHLVFSAFENTQMTKSEIVRCENICLQAGLNYRPLVYKTNALPLSYKGRPEEHDHHLVFSAFENTQMTKSEIVRCENICLQAGLNYRPLVYKTNALPLSYKGRPEEHDHHLVFSAFENTQMTKSEIVRCENICLQAGLNYRPLVYKTNALPLSYKGRPEEHDHHLVFSAFENTQMTKSEIVRCENICLQAGLNYRPLVYKTNALPLSYKGRPEEHDHHLVFSAFENTQMTKSEIVRCENICLQAGLNYRPLVYKTNALPLSYKGRPEEHDHHLVFSAFENTQMTKSEIVRCENICLQAGLNYRPLVYKTNALPLSYKGRPEEHDHHLVFSAFENTQMTKSEIVRCENICLQAGLNYRPLVYKTNALPLSYKGRPEEHDHHLVFSAFENTQMTKSEIVRCENICLQAGLNYRPLVYKTNALPLSYKGRPEEHDHHLVFSAFENTQMTKSEIVRCENICLQAGLNYRPLVYKTNALPLSYKGRPEEHDHHLVFSAFENTQMTKSEIVRCENICLQAGLNYRPLVYKTNALPLSYKGRPEEHDHHLVFSAFENTQMTKSEIVRCENICLQAGLNYRPLVYKTNALPLSYKGRPEEHDHHLVFSAFENTQMTKSEIVRCENICLQAGLNYRPLVYKTNALPLSYKGMAEKNKQHFMFLSL
ncbi:unnamed protein product [Auanema sp. JU1783]|nr:unnamed protein product [Auanema sp. JU1783]